MKVMQVVLIGLALLVFGGVAMAGDPYAGSYSCSGSPMQGCTNCPDFSVEGPKRMVINPVSGKTYKFCDEDGDCENGDINGGVVRWQETDSGEGMTIKSTVIGTFGNNSFTLEEHGDVSGDCSCEFTVKTLCTK